MRKRVLSALVLASVTGYSVPVLSQETPEVQLAVKKVNVAKDLLTNSVVTIIESSKKEIKVAAVLRRCGNNGIAAAVLALNEAKKAKLRAQILDLSDGPNAAVLTRDERVITLALSDVAMAAYSLGVEETVSLALSPTARSSTCAGAMQAADDLLGKK